MMAWWNRWSRRNYWVRIFSNSSKYYSRLHQIHGLSGNHAWILSNVICMTIINKKLLKKLDCRSSIFFKSLEPWSALRETRFSGEDLDDFDDFDDFVEALIEELPEEDGPFLPAVQTLLLQYGHYLQNNLESVEKALIEYLRLRVKTLIYSQNKPTVIYLSWCFSNNSKMNEILTSAGIYSDLILQSERTAITVC